MNVRRIKDVAHRKSTTSFHDYLRSGERKLRKFLVTSRAILKHFGARLSDISKYKRTIVILTGKIWNKTLIESYAYRKLYTG